MRPNPLLLAACALLAGCGPRAPAAPPERVPAPQPVAAARPRPAPPPAEVCRCFTLCIVQNGELRDVPVGYNTTTGDTTTREGLPLTQIAPLTSEYAAVAGWYVNREAIRFRGRRYTLYGRSRVLAINEIARAGMHGRVPVFVERGDTASAPVLYLPVRPGCEFQPYTPTGWRGRGD